MPKASQVYSYMCCESVFDPEGVVEVHCLLWSINLVSLRDMKNIGPTHEKVIAMYIKKILQIWSLFRFSFRLINSFDTLLIINMLIKKGAKPRLFFMFG